MVTALLKEYMRIGEWTPAGPTGMSLEMGWLSCERKAFAQESQAGSRAPETAGGRLTLTGDLPTPALPHVGGGAIDVPTQCPFLLK